MTQPIAPEQAVNNLDQVVAQFSCNRATRQALEESMALFREAVVFKIKADAATAAAAAAVKAAAKTAADKTAAEQPKVALAPVAGTDGEPSPPVG